MMLKRLAVRIASVCLALSGLALALCGTPASAQTPDLAYGAFQRGHYFEAFSEAAKRIEADATDAAAMTLIGEILSGGLGLPPDEAKAADWFRLAAARGDANASFSLAMMTLAGRGVARDTAAGLALLEKAAASGHAEAQYNLGLARLSAGREEEAGRLIRQSAESGLAAAQFAHARQLKDGRGGQVRDAKEAARWMEKAAENGDEAAIIEYAVMLFNGEGTQRDEAAAARLFLRGASRGNAIAQNRLARLHIAGRGVDRDLVEAAAWHIAAQLAGRADPWLDSAIAGLTPEERRQAEERAVSRIGAFRVGLTSP